MTNYVILRRADEGNRKPALWEQFTAAYAKNPKAAIRKALEGSEPGSWEFMVILASSSRVYPVEVAQTTEIRFP